MKAISLLILSSIVAITCPAEIINGYKTELEVAEKSLVNLTRLMQVASCAQNDDKIFGLKSHYLRAKRTCKYARLYYQKTQELIESLKSRHPFFYLELNEIKNHYGTVTDIYIRLIPDDRMEHAVFGSTNLDQTDGDPHLYQSNFGPNTVSVKIRECSPFKQVQLLVHELGHVKYQVPNLASYVKYYDNTYREQGTKNLLGHFKNDPSNRSVVRELVLFRTVVYRKEKFDRTLMLAEDTGGGLKDEY